ncbi:hypothetical protein TVNIR_2347 [Thioalkalivibrio nitratireducens DSM 14787]|uniref:Uncharacterized protein n=1 Tax=Thioalkalivibrio nitratireducens (strain DSM 14787 / UNIQEM 213 / ALEN2) TaxID=1255043 RepID=L0DYF5_THIND|nr:hypothetical protein TVNIR_2347 [Thioalkalivibrio nitratireducens DSM 14787]
MIGTLVVAFEEAMLRPGSAGIYDLIVAPLILALIVLILFSIGFLLGFAAHRLVRRRWPRPKTRFVFDPSSTGNQLIGTGLLIIASYFAWLFLIISVPRPDAWWWLPWSEFQYLGYPFFFVGGALIAWGIRRSLVDEDRETAGD